MLRFASVSSSLNSWKSVLEIGDERQDALLVLLAYKSLFRIGVSSSTGLSTGVLSDSSLALATEINSDAMFR
jgi:hypothetical protein